MREKLNFRTYIKRVMSTRYKFIFDDFYPMRYRFNLYDIYGWALLLQELPTYEDNTPLKDIYEGNATPTSPTITKPPIDFLHFTILLYHQYNFNTETFNNVYNTQHDIIDILDQIINRHNYRFEKNIVRERPTIPYHIHLNPNKPYPLPKLTTQNNHTYPIAITTPITRLHQHKQGRTITIRDQNGYIQDTPTYQGLSLEHQPYIYRQRFNTNPTPELIIYNKKQLPDALKALQNPTHITIKPINQTYHNTKWTIKKC